MRTSQRPVIYSEDRRPVLNTELLTTVMAYIEDHPDEWSQDWWAKSTPCGTSFCFAGHAVHIAVPDARFCWQDSDKYPGKRQAALLVSADGAHFSSIAVRARSVLGLTSQQAHVLFREDNTLDDLKRHVKTLCDEGVVYAKPDSFQLLAYFHPESGVVVEE
jgi:hypothetical protein